MFAGKICKSFAVWSRQNVSWTQRWATQLNAKCSSRNPAIHRKTAKSSIFIWHNAAEKHLYRIYAKLKRWFGQKGGKISAINAFSYTNMARNNVKLQVRMSLVCTPALATANEISMHRSVSGYWWTYIENVKLYRLAINCSKRTSKPSYNCHSGTGKDAKVNVPSGFLFSAVIIFCCRWNSRRGKQVQIEQWMNLTSLTRIFMQVPPTFSVPPPYNGRVQFSQEYTMGPCKQLRNAIFQNSWLSYLKANFHPKYKRTAN